MHTTRHIAAPAQPLPLAFVFALGLAALLAANHASAQGDRVEVGGSGLAFDVPAGWSLSEDLDDDGVSYGLESPDGTSVIVIATTAIGAEVAREIAALGADAVLDTWEGFVEEVPGARIERRYEAEVAGRRVGRIDYVGDGFAGAVLQVLGDGVLVTVVAFAPDDAAAAVLDALDGVLAGLSVTAPRAATSDTALAATGGGNPLAAAGGGNPLAAAGGGNPLAATGGGNPLAGVAEASAATRGAADLVHLEPFSSLDASTVFGGTLDVGRVGAWDGSLTGDAYVLHNDADPTAVRYYYANALPGIPGPLSAAQVGVDVVVQGAGDFGAAGVLFDVDPERGTYLAFALTDRGVAVLRNSGNGLELLVNEPSDAVIVGGVNRIEVRPLGTEVAMVVNGHSAMTLQSTTPFTGGVGILAIGAGTYAFSDLVVDAR